MARRYLTGKDGAVLLGSPGTAFIVDEWTYEEKPEVVRSRGGGDGAFSRKTVAIDWEANVRLLVPETDTPLDISTLRNTSIAFVLDSDGTPKVRVEGAGLATSPKYSSPIGDNLTIELRIECDDADEANLPTITTI